MRTAIHFHTPQLLECAALPKSCPDFTNDTQTVFCKAVKIAKLNKSLARQFAIVGVVRVEILTAHMLLQLPYMLVLVVGLVN